MQIDRRTFLKRATGAAIATAAMPLPAFPLFQQSDESTARRGRVALYYEPTFPPGEIDIQKETLQKAFDGFDVVFMGVNELKTLLNTSGYDLIVNPYGSFFPKEGYGALAAFLKAGGNWVNIGGVPLSIPVDRQGGVWRKGVSQTSYHKKLGITQAFRVKSAGLHFESGTHPGGAAENLSKEFAPQEIYELYVRFAAVNDFPDESGTAGQRDAVLYPLLHGVNERKQRIAAPFIQIDRLQGEYAGGRWLFASFKGTISAKGIRTMADLAIGGALELSARSTFACYHEGELPSFTIQLRSPKGNIGKLIREKFQIEIRNEQGKLIERLTVQLAGEGTVAAGTVHMTQRGLSELSPGFYEIRIESRVQPSVSERPRTLHLSGGFWVFDANLMKSGKLFTVDKDFLLRDGQPYPVTGTTYMASDVHRKFLFEANPFLWRNDFKEMKASGVNMVRTGIWTGWKNYMPEVGVPNEAVLRAMDAFLLTARKYDIPLIFTFFAFLPAAWGGVNAYLDPRAVNGQKEFILAFVQRYRMVSNIFWDLINEPSFCNPQHLWECRPNYDAYETAAWHDWLKERYRYPSDDERIARLQELYRTTADETLDLPKLEEFADANIFANNHPLKVIDYRLFAQEMFARWVKEMAAVIRANGNKNQLVTVGQDEGGTGESPSPQFFSETVDFTCIHNWWLNDNLVWDSVVTKVPGKPNLVEETGVMFYEKMDGTPWRTEEEARDLLERKLAISIGAGGAGFLEWIWNTNPYMTSDNEAAIGLYRVDGTAKPELEPLANFARFFASNKQLMKGRQDEDIVMVIPHSQQFSTRNFASEATKNCVRVMLYHCNARMSAVSEYQLSHLKGNPKLIILPSPRVLHQTAWDAMMKLVDQGSTLVVSGAVDADEHWLAVRRMKEFGVEAASRPVTQEEFLMIDGHEYGVSYRGDKIQRIEKTVVEKAGAPSVMTFPRGRGSIIWSPLPLEVADVVEPIAALYRFALRQANVSPVYSVDRQDPSVLILPSVFAEAILYTFVSESDRDTALIFTDNGSKARLNVTVPAQRTAALFIDRSDGKILSKLG